MHRRLVVKSFPLHPTPTTLPNLTTVYNGALSTGVQLIVLNVKLKLSSNTSGQIYGRCLKLFEDARWLEERAATWA